MKKYRTHLLARLGLLILLLTGSAVFAADDFQTLIGRWQRPDGGYVMEIRSIAPDGKMLGGYFNPRPINVSQAQASLQKGYIKVEVELRDTGYPGSRYTLIYDQPNDRLIGWYYHAVSGQNFEVVFVRQK